MGSTYNVGQNSAHGVDGTPDNLPFDLNQGLAHTALLWDGPLIFENVGGSEYNDLAPARAHDPGEGSETYRIPEYEGWVSGGSPDPNSVPMKLLELPEKEMAALLGVYPKAKVEGNCITTAHYLVVVKRFLCELKLLDNHIKEVPSPKEYARLLSRLSREMGSCSFDPDSMLDPGDYAGCLVEMLDDMEKTLKILDRDGILLKKVEEAWGPDVCVYVSRDIVKYPQCLLAAAEALNNC